MSRECATAKLPHFGRRVENEDLSQRYIPRANGAVNATVSDAVHLTAGGVTRHEIGSFRDERLLQTLLHMPAMVRLVIVPN